MTHKHQLKVVRRGRVEVVCQCCGAHSTFTTEDLLLRMWASEARMGRKRIRAHVRKSPRRPSSAEL